MQFELLTLWDSGVSPLTPTTVAPILRYSSWASRNEHACSHLSFRTNFDQPTSCLTISFGKWKLHPRTDKPAVYGQRLKAANSSTKNQTIWMYPLNKSMLHQLPWMSVGVIHRSLRQKVARSRAYLLCASGGLVGRVEVEHQRPAFELGQLHLTAILVLQHCGRDWVAFWDLQWYSIQVPTLVHYKSQLRKPQIRAFSQKRNRCPGLQSTSFLAINQSSLDVIQSTRD